MECHMSYILSVKENRHSLYLFEMKSKKIILNNNNNNSINNNKCS
jgi:hypothetical protein